VGKGVCDGLGQSTYAAATASQQTSGVHQTNVDQRLDAPPTLSGLILAAPHISCICTHSKRLLPPRTLRRETLSKSVSHRECLAPDTLAPAC
jgi:hypothetical protein